MAGEQDEYNRGLKKVTQNRKEASKALENGNIEKAQECLEHISSFERTWGFLTSQIFKINQDRGAKKRFVFRTDVEAWRAYASTKRTERDPRLPKLSNSDIAKLIWKDKDLNNINASVTVIRKALSQKIDINEFPEKAQE